MPNWTIHELKIIGASEELKLSALKKDGTFYKPVIIWVVRVEDDLYVRSYKGINGNWFKHLQVNQKGSISAGGITKFVNLIFLNKEDKTVNDKIDQEYRLKYRKYGNNYVDPMISTQARVTTIRLIPF